MDNSFPIGHNLTPPTSYYIFAEDLVSALVGPFPTLDAAKAHLTFLEERGDGAEAEVITEWIASKLNESSIDMRMTPEEDRAYAG